MIAFWHRPSKWIDSKRKWHAYGSDGRSACREFFVGVKPEDAKPKMPTRAHPSDICKACAAVDRTIAR